MSKRPTVTIGIPAYNEERNIANLLTHLLTQKSSHYNLLKIIVISDGSSDQTVMAAKQISDKRIDVIGGKSRLGKAARINQIFALAHSDLLITLDADVSPHDHEFLSKIVSKLVEKDSTVLTCVKVTPASDSSSLITRVLAHSQLMKIGMFESIRAQSPVYLFIGRAFGYKKVLYEQLRFPQGLMAEDAYACLYCLKNNMGISYQSRAVIYYAPPATLSDHLKQSARFYNSESQLANYFGANFIKESYKISRITLLKAFLTSFTQSSNLTILYVLILIYSKLLVSFHWIKSSYLWDISSSSKKVANHI